MEALRLAPRITIKQYLRMSFEHEPEYIDGHLEERPVPEYDHADMKAFIGYLLHLHGDEWRVRVAGSALTQTTSTRLRLPDVCVTDASKPREQILYTPPLLCVEILSPEDHLSQIKQKAQEYLAMGVLAVWIVDTEKRMFHVITPTTTTEHREGTVTVPNTPIQLDILEAFSTLDE